MESFAQATHPAVLRNLADDVELSAVGTWSPLRSWSRWPLTPRSTGHHGVGPGQPPLLDLSEHPVDRCLTGSPIKCLFRLLNRRPSTTDSSGDRDPPSKHLLFLSVATAPTHQLAFRCPFLVEAAHVVRARSSAQVGEGGREVTGNASRPNVKPHPPAKTGLPGAGRSAHAEGRAQR